MKSLILCLHIVSLVVKVSGTGSSSVEFLSAPTSGKVDSLSTNLDTLPDPEPESEFLIPVEEGKIIPNFRLIPEGKKSKRVRRADGPRCPNAPLGDPFLYFANRQFLALMNTDASGLRSFTATQYMTAADYDIKGCYIIWSDVQARHIARAKMDATGYTVLINTGITVVDGLAWDWVHNNLYWTDAEERDIERVHVTSTTTNQRKVILQTGNAGESIPRAIVVDPVVSNKIYWTDWGSRPRIERASLNGQNREVIQALNLQLPNALAIDIYTQTLYWADAGLDRIECSSVNGSNRRLLIAQFILHPFAMDFCNDTLYWSDWEQKAVLTSAIYHTTAQPRFTVHVVINNLLHLPMGVKCISHSKQPKGPITVRREFLCIPDCQNGGTCSANGVCTCTPGWRGNRCQEAICDPVCSNGGTCTAPSKCLCGNGWEGSTCQQPVCNGGCENGGTCVNPDLCQCPRGWEGPRCDIPVCSHICENGGRCTGPDTCTCRHGWTGALCDEAVCNPPCENGNCAQPDECLCNRGWTGRLCDDPICDPGCTNGGDCVAPGTCECHSPFYGPTCAEVECFPPSGCLNGGHCVSPSLCACPTGFDGVRCESPLCGSIRCIHGTCKQPNECACNFGWNGRSCDEAICFPPDGCQNGGWCVIPGICSCASGWQGDKCDEGVCQPSCRNGVCTAPNECTCHEGWEGPICTQAICHNGCVNGICIRPNLCVCNPGFYGDRCQ